MITNLIAMIRRTGATMVEYGLLVALIALVAIVGVTLLGTNLNPVQHRGGLRLKRKSAASPLSDFSKEVVG